MNTLPEACIAKILSFTTPLDICRLSAVSKTFNAAANSDDVWKNFFLTDFPVGYATPRALLTQKELFFYLVHHPILLHDSQLSFWLDRRSGSKCYMLAARTLNIAWENDQRYWKWISIPNTMFREVAELILVYWLEIIGKIDITLLSDDTLYAAFLVFKWNHVSYDFNEPEESVEASIFLVDIHIVDTQPSMVSLMENRGNEEGHYAELRRDGWYEVKLGQFFKKRKDFGELKTYLKETKKLDEKRGLIVLSKTYALIVGLFT